jgi:hypothetical protein
MRAAGELDTWLAAAVHALPSAPAKP